MSNNHRAARPRPSSYAGPAPSLSSSSRQSILPSNGSSTSTNVSTSSVSAAKNRHLSHLHAQLAQLSANLSDLENLLRMTAVQAESMRGLGGFTGGMFMAASKVLGEDAVAATTTSSTSASTSATTTATETGRGAGDGTNTERHN